MSGLRFVEQERGLLWLGGIRLRWGGRWVLQGVDLKVGEGEIVTLIGPNGAGKSSLIKVALGLIKPQAGEVVRRAGLVVGYVPQELDLDATLPLTVRRFLRLEKGVSREAVTEALRRAGVEEVGETAVQGLSRGELRRVLLARALLRRPGLLIMDEPAAGMDVGGQAALYRLLRELREQQGCGILLVSHDLHMVMAATDRVYCLNREVRCSGRPGEVQGHPGYQGLFGEAGGEGEVAVYRHHHHEERRGGGDEHEGRGDG